MADRQALDAVLRKLLILCDVVGVCRHPLRMVEPVQIIKSPFISWMRLAWFNSLAQQLHQSSFDCRIICDSHQLFIGLDTVFAPTIEGKPVLPRRQAITYL